MPGMSGRELADSLKRARPDIKGTLCVGLHLRSRDAARNSRDGMRTSAKTVQHPLTDDAGASDSRWTGPDASPLGLGWAITSLCICPLSGRGLGLRMLTVALL